MKNLLLLSLLPVCGLAAQGGVWRPVCLLLWAYIVAQSSIWLGLY